MSGTEDLKQKSDQFLEQLYARSGESSQIMNGRDILQDIGMDEQTGINVVEYLASRNLLKVLARSIGNDASVLDAVEITMEGLKHIDRLREAKGGIPLFYTEPLDNKSDKELRQFIAELNDRLGRIGTGSRVYILTKEKIAQAKYELEHRGAVRNRSRSTWAIVIAIIALIVSILLKIFLP